MYWPNLFYQNGGGALNRYSHNSTGWQHTFVGPSPGIIAMKNSGLVIMPKNHTVVSLWYQEQDGTLAEYYFNSTSNVWAPGMVTLLVNA